MPGLVSLGIHVFQDVPIGSRRVWPGRARPWRM